MPVTLATANHASRKWTQAKAESTQDLFQNSCPKDSRKSKNIIQSSFSEQLFHETHVSSSTNGFVRAVYHAYSGHHHLTLRPEDVWFSILSQLNFFINAHAEELRSFFVSHQGRKELEIVEVGTRDSVDFGALAERMTELIQKNVLDPELRTWVMPSFSTTTDCDRVVAAILMMGSLQKYFSYKMSLVCGIPSVTLLGERVDWENILKKLDRIPHLGQEPAQFAELLKPILRYFVSAFDDPISPSVLDFWSKVAHQTGGSGPFYLSGWITAFCFWDEDGKSLYGTGPIGPVTLEAFMGSRAGCELDGVLFHRVNTDKIPSGFTSVPVTVDDNGETYETTMVAGSIGIQVTSSGQRLDDPYGHSHEQIYTEADEKEPDEDAPEGQTEESGLDSLQPLSGWWMYERWSSEEDQAREEERKAIADEIQKLLSQGGDIDLKRLLELSRREEELAY